LGRRQRDKQDRTSAKGNAVASLVEGGKVVRKGGLATKKCYDKTASFWTRKICRELQTLHNSKAARRANVPRIAKDGKLHQGLQLCQGERVEDSYLAGSGTSRTRATLPSAAMLLRKYVIPPTKIFQVETNTSATKGVTPPQ
jgi:hypothetical protein